jgi:hypothetical protein
MNEPHEEPIGAEVNSYAEGAAVKPPPFLNE